jgi:hypothetical protein
MKIAVKDANVLIDLIEADLLGLWFQLGIETHTADLVVREEGILDPANAVIRLTRAREAGAFFPKDECEARMHRWRRT